MPALLTAVLLTAGVQYQWALQTSQSYVSALSVDTDGSIWCATCGGLVHFDPDQGWLQPLLYPDGFPWIGANDILIQDSLIWVGTDGAGLALLEGDEWSIFSTYEGVPGTGVVHAVTGAGGYVWAGTDGGLARGGPDGFIDLDSEITGGGFEADQVTGIASLGDTMYLATDRGVYGLDLTGSVFDPGSWTSYASSTASLGIQGLLAHSPDSLFGYGTGGVSESTGSGWTRLLDYSSSEDSVITGLLMTGDGLIASGRVVLRYTGGGWVHYGEGYPDESYASCLEEVDGRIWCGFGTLHASTADAGRGLGYLQDGNWVHVPVPGMGGASCYQMTRAGGVTYLGSHNMGLMAHYPGYGWTQFDRQSADIPRALRCYSAAVTDAPGVWTGAYHWGLTWIDDRGTYVMSDDTVITYVSDSLPGLPSQVVQVLCPLLNNQVVMLASQEGDLWVAQEAYWQTPEEASGLVAVAGFPEEGDLQWATRTEADGLAARNIRRIFPCGSDSLWISFASDGGCQLLVHGGDPLDKSEDTWYPAPGQAYTTSWGLPSGQVFCFARDSGGNIFLGTGSGVCRWNGSVFVETGGIVGSVKSMETDSHDALWCMTEQALYRIDDSGTSEFNLSNSIYIPTSRTENEFSYRDPETGSVFFSSLTGLWSLSPGSAVHEGPSPLFYPQPYLPSQGELRMAWSGEPGPVRARFHSLTGEYLGEVSAVNWQEWSWDGALDGEDLASGVYFVIVGTGTGSTTNKIALVR